MSYVIFKNRKFTIHNKNNKNEESPQIELLDIKIDSKIEQSSDNKNKETNKQSLLQSNIQKINNPHKPKVSKSYQEFLDSLKISDE
jgi:hypothetical protein